MNQISHRRWLNRILTGEFGFSRLRLELSIMRANRVLPETIESEYATHPGVCSRAHIAEGVRRGSLFICPAIIAMFLFLITACAMESADPPVERTSRHQTEITEEPETPDNAIRLSATDLSSDYKKNKLAAHAKYDGLTIVVSGSVAKFNTDQFFGISIELGGDSAGGVVCHLADEQPNLDTLSPKLNDLIVT